jgi:hypothetical protein
MNFISLYGGYVIMNVNSENNVSNIHDQSDMLSQFSNTECIFLVYVKLETSIVKKNFNSR